jgi:hypothetical protein
MRFGKRADLERTWAIEKARKPGMDRDTLAELRDKSDGAENRDWRFSSPPIAWPY